MSVARACAAISRCLDSEDFPRALRAIAEAGQRYPEAEAVWMYWTGWLFLRQEAPGRALQAMEAALRIEPSAREFLYGVACANNALGLFHEVMFCAKISPSTREIAPERDWGCLLTEPMRAIERSLFLVDSDSVLHKVQEHMASGAYLRAAQIAEDALFAFPQNRSWRVAAVEGFLASQRPFSALELLMPFTREDSLALCEQVLIARAFAALGQTDQALVWHRSVFAADSTLASNRSAFLRTLSSMRRPLPSAFVSMRRKLHSADHKPRALRARKPNLGKRIRIGIVSPNLQVGGIDAYAGLLFETFKTSALEIFLYIDSPRKDALSERFLSNAKESFTTHAIDDYTLARILFEDRIDIMLELDSHVRYRRHASARLKPASLQLVAFGDPIEARLWGYDAVLSDVFLTPHESQAQGCPVLRTPHGFLNFAEMVAVPLAPRRNSRNRVRFGVSAPHRALDEKARSLLLSCLASAKQARLLLDTERIGGEKAVSFLQSAFEKEGGKSLAQRIEALPQDSSIEVFLKHTDVFLDVAYPRSPYMLWQALRRALPAVTLGGVSSAERFGFSIVAQQIGQSDGQALCLAADECALRTRVQALASDSAERARTHHALLRSREQDWAKIAAVKALSVAETLLDGLAKHGRCGRYNPRSAP